MCVYVRVREQEVNYFKMHGNNRMEFGFFISDTHTYFKEG